LNHASVLLDQARPKIGEHRRSLLVDRDCTEAEFRRRCPSDDGSDDGFL